MKTRKMKQQSIPFSPQAFEEIKRKIEAEKSATRVLTKEQAKEVLDNIHFVYDMRCGVCNAIASYAMTDALGAIESIDDWDDVKSLVRQALRKYEAYEDYKRKVFYKYKNFSLWTDTVDGVYNEAKRHIQMLQYSIRQQATKAGVKNTFAWAWMETAYTILDHACQYFDLFSEEVKDTYHVDLRHKYRKERMTEPFELWKKACLAMRRKNKEKELCINLRDDKNCLLAVKLYRNVVEKEDCFVNCCMQAILENRELVAEEGYRDIKKFKEQIQKEKARREHESKELERKFKEQSQRSKASDISKEELQLLKKKFNKS